MSEKVKPIFTDEAEARRLLRDCFCACESRERGIEVTLENLKRNGYIFPDPVEEAEFVIVEIKRFWESHDEPYELGEGEVKIIEKAIQHLKQQLKKHKGETI